MEFEENSLKNSVGEYAWFAMSATFGRELKAKDFLEKEEVECFIPMKYEIIDDRKQGKTRKLIPAIHNLLFVHTTKERIQALKTGLSYLQYLTKPLDGRNIPIIVPDNQMQQFITVLLSKFLPHPEHRKQSHFRPHQIQWHYCYSEDQR